MPFPRGCGASMGGVGPIGHDCEPCVPGKLALQRTDSWAHWLLWRTHRWACCGQSTNVQEAAGPEGASPPTWDHWSWITGLARRGAVNMLKGLNEEQLQTERLNNTWPWFHAAIKIQRQQPNPACQALKPWPARVPLVFRDRSGLLPGRAVGGAQSRLTTQTQPHRPVTSFSQ